MKKTFLAVSFLALSLGGCAGTSSTALLTSEPVEQSDVQWSLVDSVDLEAINSDLEIGKPTVDIGLYYPSNLHPDAVEKLPLSGLVEEFLNAKKVFEPTGVQFKLLWIKTGQVDPQHPVRVGGPQTDPRELSAKKLQAANDVFGGPPPQLARVAAPRVRVSTARAMRHAAEHRAA